jgi:catalase-peroxidase
LLARPAATDPDYRRVCEKFLADFDAFTQAFSKAWYKLTHRDMGPRERYLGPEKKLENDLLWQDPIPPREHPTIGKADVAAVKQSIMAAGISASDLVFTAFSAAATYRNSDKRGTPTAGAWRFRRKRTGWSISEPCR